MGLVGAMVPSVPLTDAVLVAAVGVAPEAPRVPLSRAALVLLAAVVALAALSVGPRGSAGVLGGSAEVDVARVKPGVAAAALVPVEEDWVAVRNAGAGIVDETTKFPCVLGSTVSGPAGGEEPCSCDRIGGVVLGTGAATAVDAIATVPTAAGTAVAVAAATGSDKCIVCPASTELSAGLSIGTVAKKGARSRRAHHVTNTGNIDGSVTATKPLS